MEQKMPSKGTHSATSTTCNSLRMGLPAMEEALQHLFLHLEDSPYHEIETLTRGDERLVSARRRQVIDGLKGEWELIRLAPDLFVRVSNFAGPGSVSFPIVGEGLIEFNFRLSGRLRLSMEIEDKSALETDRGTLLIWRQPVGHAVTGWLDAEREASVTFYLHPDALPKFFGNALARLPDGLLERMRSDERSVFSMQLNLIPKVTALLHQLMHLQASGPLRLVQAEALVMLILCEVLWLLEAAPVDAHGTGRITDAEVRCLRRARTILHERCSPPPTIDALAREVGVGATKLKSGFKCLFGTTISQYANDVRMARARELLVKPDISIWEVSETLGYEYQNSFTAAFRRHFGVLPKDFRRDPLILDRALA